MEGLANNEAVTYQPKCLKKNNNVVLPFTKSPNKVKLPFTSSKNIEYSARFKSFSLSTENSSSSSSSELTALAEE